MFVIVLLLSITFSQNLSNTQAEQIEVDFGWNYPTGQFDKYADDGSYADEIYWIESQTSVCDSIHS